MCSNGGDRWGRWSVAVQARRRGTIGAVGVVGVSVDGEIVGLRRELVRLRAENARLSRLLDLRGLDTAPAPEQLAAPVTPPGLVTMASPVQDKLALYADRFRARTDVYAVRWENARTGARGWMPAVAGGWRRGMDRAAATYLPLTAQVLAAHLIGDVFIGLYPLLRGQHAAGSWRPTSTGRRRCSTRSPTPRRPGPPGCRPRLEISQSGRGAHVWVLFTDPVAGQVARAVGTVLVHEAMVLRGSMDLRSYDRLFPNQDVLPDGGFGNLIAAPLQGRRRRDGLTAFLDLATLEPYEDQWEFLSTLDRLSPGDAARIARRATTRRSSAPTSPRSAGRPRPGSTRRCPRSCHAEIGAGLSLDTTQLPPAALATFKHAASMANPKFYELQRLRKSTWDTPRFVRGYDLTLDDRMILPRGLRHIIDDIVERAGSRLAVTDVPQPRPRDRRRLHRGTHDHAGRRGRRAARPRRRRPGRPTRLRQDRHGLRHDRRTRHLHPRSLSTAKPSPNNGAPASSQFLGIKPGQVGGGRRKLGGIVDIAMLPSLARHADVAELTHGYGQVIVDECHHLAAAAYDHSVKRIGAQFWLGLTATPDPPRRTRRTGHLATRTHPAHHHPRRTPARSPTPLDSRQPDHDGCCTSTRPHSATTTSTRPHRVPRPLHHRARHRRRPATPRSSTTSPPPSPRGRNCLVLTRRVAHLEILTTMLADARPPGDGAAGRHVRRRPPGRVHRLADTKSGDGVLVIGTTPFIGEGFDAPALDTLFLAAPISFGGLLIQCAGRVIRAAPGKDTAEVHDYHDHSHTHPRRLTAAPHARLPHPRLHPHPTTELMPPTGSSWCTRFVVWRIPSPVA